MAYPVSSARIKRPTIKTTKTALEFDESGIVAEIMASYTSSLDGASYIPNMLFYIQERTELTRSTILEVLVESGRIGDALVNPHTVTLSRLIPMSNMNLRKNVRAEMILNSILSFLFGLRSRLLLANIILTGH